MPSETSKTRSPRWSWPSVSSAWLPSPGLTSRTQQRLDGAALVHGLVAFGDLFQGQGEVEDLARVDTAVDDALDEVGKVGPHGGGTTTQPDVGEEELLAVDPHVVRHADEADVAAGAGGAEGRGRGTLGSFPIAGGTG